MDNGYRLYKYVDSKSLLVVKQDGVLVRIYCPFPVKPLKNKENAILTVGAISQENDGSLYYYISGTWYRYSLFLILPRK